jgi:hypothetical protein
MESDRHGGNNDCESVAQCHAKRWGLSHVRNPLIAQLHGLITRNIQSLAKGSLCGLGWSDGDAP